MKKIACLLAAAVLLLSSVPALADGSYLNDPKATLLADLTHNCPNTGIMLPDSFSPYQTTYLLTVADWVSRPTFTPTAFDPGAVITVNGKVVKSGHKSQVINMTDKPQAVEIVVTNGGFSTVYTIFLQRRPSEKRTKVSAGYINSIYLKGTTWHIDADLVTVEYAGEDYDSGNLSTFTNTKVETNVYDYPVAANCMFYTGTKAKPVRCQNVQEFMSKYMSKGSPLYTIIYMESEIIAVLPYGADY